MKKLLLTLLTMPTVATILLPLSVRAANVKPATYTITGNQLCVTQHGRQYCVKQTKPNAAQAKEAALIASTFEEGIEFTDEESYAAIQMFGCDCPACIRSLKQINTFTGGKA